MTTLVTGANGFVGSALCERLRKDGLSVRGAVRALSARPEGIEVAMVGHISSDTDWSAALLDVKQVVHLAARVHVINEKSSNPLAEFRRVNVEGTARLARQAAALGVKRFVFLSSIKVNGESTEVGRPFTADDVAAPQSAYGVSKFEAELLLRQLASETQMEVVIIRPPLVYGPGVGANFQALMRWLARDLPLPLAAVTENRRSMVAVDNLVDLIVNCLDHPLAPNETFLVSDGEDISTAELLWRMGNALGRNPQLIYVPPGLIKFVAAVVKKSEVCDRLCGSLQVDITKTRELLGWNPPVSVEVGLQRAAEGFRW